MIGLLAGNRQFPMLIARAARLAGRPMVAVAHLGESDPDLADLVDDILWVKIGELQRSIDFFKGHGVREAVMAGGITKENLFVHFAPDQRALDLIARLDRLSDDTFLRALAGEFEAEGVMVRPSTLLVPELAAPEGVLTQRSPTPEESADVAFGWKMVKEIGRLDIGQCVVVRQKTVLAVEAIDGTDATVRRGGALAREGAVVVKTPKPGQDPRFDLPAVGLNTIRTMTEVGAKVLAVEAGLTLMFDRSEMIAAADRAGIAIFSGKDAGDA